VVVGSAQDDPDAFELSLKDDCYASSEGASAVATWQLAMPPMELPSFDYASIADVVLSSATRRETAVPAFPRLE